MKNRYPYDDGCLAVIGMSARLPGAEDLEQFWDNIINGRCSMETMDPQSLVGTPYEAMSQDPDYVPVRCSMKEYDTFDASFFGFSPREVGIMDPQHRMVLEYAWRAFENAGHLPQDAGGTRTGVYASSDLGSYIMTNLYSHILSGEIEVTEAVMGTDKDYLATRIAYKNNLIGPAMTVQTACSSSLTSLHVACQALLANECDRALVTSCTILLPDVGYRYSPGGMRSPDGFCRPYDADAEGAVFSNGVAAVLLKRFDDAVADKDHIWAVVRATAVNNDGNDKVGYAAPSINGQAGAIRAALRLSGVAPEDVAYVEGHGTATVLGDPIETAALLREYGGKPRDGAPRRPVVLSSVKGNIGHLDATAGLASFIKACLSLYHGVVPGTANFSRLNPEMGDIAPFVVSSHNKPLERADDLPLLAGVSAFGFGGTNVHAVLQEAPVSEERIMRDEPELLLVSAHHEEALGATREALAERFSQDSKTPLADSAYTLATGRKHFPFRSFVIAEDHKQAAARLREQPAMRVTREVDAPMAFLFPGQGNLHPGMAKGFYVHDPLFREQLEIVADYTLNAGGPDIVDILHHCWSGSEKASSFLFNTSKAQPLLFCLEYAFASALMHKGVIPSCMAGHSLGEYVAACIAGVFTPEEASFLVVRRGELMQSAPTGKMLVVSLSSTRIREVLGDLFAKVEISVINSPANCVLSGAEKDLAECAAAVEAHGQRTTYLKTSHAFHSASMECIMEPFRKVLSELTLSPPRLPFVSNVTGEWVGEEVAEPGYWVRHLRSPVQFAKCLSTIRSKASVAIETGPGTVLRSLASQQGEGSIRVIPGLDPLRSGVSGEGETKEALPRTVAHVAGELWLAGGGIDWETYFTGSGARRCPLPGVAMRRQRFWIEPGSAEIPGMESSSSLSLENYERTCSAPFAEPETEIEKELAAIWQDLLFVKRIGIDDDFIELGGNSIQVMQMIRKAAAGGMRFSSRDVFEGKTIRGLAKRTRKGDMKVEAVPGPLTPPPYMKHLLNEGAVPHCHYRVFSCPTGFDLRQAGVLADSLARRHDALRIAWDNNGMRLLPLKALNWANVLVDDLSDEKAVLPEQVDYDSIAARLRPESGKGWSLTLLPPVPGPSLKTSTGLHLGTGPLLVLFVARALADVPSMCLIAQDVIQFFKEGNLGGDAAGYWKLWAEALQGDSFKAQAQSLAREWQQTLPQEPVKEDAGSIFADPGTMAEERSIVFNPQEGVYASVLEAAKNCRVSTEVVFAAAVGHAFQSMGLSTDRIHLYNDGRELLFDHINPACLVGCFAYRYPVPLSNVAGGAGEWLPEMKEALYTLPGQGNAAWLAESSEARAAISLLWLGEQDPGTACMTGCDMTASEPVLVHEGIWSPATSLRTSVLELTGWAQSGEMHIRLTYPDRLNQNFLELFQKQLAESLALVAAAGVSDPAASRLLPSDFQGAGVTRDDLDFILQQLGM